jgi:DNA-directed RNA polymerase specialized sigma24 family protein
LRAGSPELAEQRDLVEQIRQGLEEVEDLDRAAFVLREIEQVKVEEAAEILRTSPGRIRESVHRVYLILTSSLGLLDRARARRLLESSLTRGGDD